MPGNQLGAQMASHRFSQLGLACAGFPFDKQGLFQQDGGIDRHLERFRGEIAIASCKSHNVHSFDDERPFEIEAPIRKNKLYIL